MSRHASLGILVALVLTPSLVEAQVPLLDGYSGPRGFGTDCLSPNDDGSSAAIDLTPAFPDGLEFFGRHFSTAYVNTNGNLTFHEGLSDYTPDPFPVSDRPMIAPYWADVDIRGADCDGFGGDLGCENPDDNGVWWHLEPGLMVVTWDRVGYFGCNDDLKMSFQLILREARYCGIPGDFDVEFRYNRCDWETGDIDGVGGFGEPAAQVGFDAGNETDFVSVPGSRMSGISTIMCTTSNVGEPGVWRFRIRRGNIECPDAGELCETGEVGVCGEGRTQCDGAGTVCQQVLEPSDERCDALDNDCDGTVDEGEALCGDLQVCDSGRCIDPCFEGGCPAGYACSAAGVCTEDACAAVSCEAGERCIGGSCVDVCEGVRCPAGQSCRAGGCVDLCETLSCDSCHVCVEGGCRMHCRVDGCPAGQACEETGLCVEEQCLGVICGPGSVCRGGRCSNRCTGVVCPMGQECRAGECTSEPAPDAGPRDEDGGSAPADAGSMSFDGGVNADAGPGTRPSGGCGCKVAGEPSSSGGWILGALLGLAWLARRRRRALDVRGRRSLGRVAALVLGASLASGCDGTIDAPPGACGDGEIVIPEICDDGNADGGDGCSASCTIEPGYTCAGAPSACQESSVTCGNGAVEGSEECDDGAETAACDDDCTRSACGDGHLNAARGEECDDGNAVNGDGCTTACVREAPGCGDGVCDAPSGEDCITCLLDCADTDECRNCPDRDGDGATDSACGGTDCNDFDADVHPGGTELTCNRIDEDCDPATPDALDVDGDGSSCNYDCDDEDDTRSPLFTDLCGDGIDNDCDESTPDVGDRDGDGFSCDVDCNDFNAAVNPDATEICANGIDDDCDAATPDLFDTDADGETCDTDCDDMNAAVSSNMSEVCGNGVDDDCDASTIDLFDRDGDGDGCMTDCDDDDPLRASTFTEICGNQIEDDCDASTPDNEDADGDTFMCDVDCDDADAAVVPDSLNRCGVAFRYAEDFEDDDGMWTTSASAGTSSWEWGVPAGTYIDAAAGGTRAWVTNLDGDYQSNETSYITSPALDMSLITTDPTLYFSYIYDTESGFDEVWVEMSVDGGATWSKVGRSGEGSNWYNDASDDTWNGHPGTPGVWARASHVLTGAAGHADVRIRVVLDTDVSVTAEGFGLDDVLIDNQLIDLAAVSDVIPASTCSSAAHPVSIIVRNEGSVPVSSFEVSYSLDGAAPVVETVASVLLPGRTYTHHFTTRANVTASPHAVQGRVTAPMDGFAANDTRANAVSVAGSFVTLGAGYSEDFEGDAGGWVSSGTSSSWAWGTPSGSFISAAASGTGAWVTNLSGEYNEEEASYLTSTCLDFSGTTADPTLSFQHIFETDEDLFGDLYDPGWVEVFTPQTGWRRLGAVGTGTNWYNDGFYEGWVGVSGASGAWRTASHVLTGTAGEPIVRIRYVFESDDWDDSAAEGFGVDDVTITPAP